MEWVFFVDGAVVVLSVVAALLQWRSFTEAGVASVGVAIGYTLMLAAYWTPRAILRARASRCSPAGTRSLIPSAVIPWRYFGCAGEGKNILLFRINALTGAIDQERRQLVLDDEYSAILGTASEYRIMRQLSPAYHVVQASPVAEGIEVTCRDLRTRNFGGRFGELIVTLDENGQIVRKELNV